MYRNQKTITCYKGTENEFTVDVYEIKVDTALSRLIIILGFFKWGQEVTTLKADTERTQKIIDLISENKGVIEGFLSESTSLGENIKEVGGSAFIDIIEAFMEVNRPFLEKADSLTQKAKKEKDAAILKEALKKR